MSDVQARVLTPLDLESPSTTEADIKNAFKLGKC